MKMIQPHAGFNGKRGHRAFTPAFTLIEIMISLLILGILLALIIGGAKLAIRTAKKTVDNQAVHSINMGASQFKQLFGFYVPLIRDEDPNPPNARTTIVQISGAGTPHNRINVHRATDGAPVPYLTFMQGPGTGVTPTNPLIDDRYSECSIPVYLAGQLTIPLDPADPNGPPIDGITGAGFCKPVIDGTFAIPSDILHPPVPGANSTRRTGTTYEPLISLGSSAPKLLVDPDHMPGGPGFNPEKVQVVDRNNVAIRYYRWEHGSQTPPPAGSPLPLNIPMMVGRNFNDPAYPLLMGIPVPADRDISRNANLRGAVYAIVAAGPNGVFGDEPSLDYICQKLGITYDTSLEVKIRMQAEQDNIVEVGQ